MIRSLVLLLLTSSNPSQPLSPGTVIPFRTDVQPRIDPVFGDAGTLRAAIDRFLSLQAGMEQVRDEFSTAVHQTLAALAPVASLAAPKTCPAGAAAPYARALAAGGRYLLLGQQLQARYQDIRRADELGDAVALTPDYRAKVKKAKELYQQLLNDYREMRVAFYDQLGAEMRHATCKTGSAAVATGGASVPSGRTEGPAAVPNPSNPDAWVLEQASERSAGQPVARTAAAGPSTGSPAAPEPVAEAEGATLAAPAIWIDLDNTLCAQATRVSIDGQPLGEVGAHKRTSVRTHAGPREVCVLPVGDARACGDPGTIRKAYLHEGWSLSVHCEK